MRIINVDPVMHANTVASSGFNRQMQKGVLIRGKIASRFVKNGVNRPVEFVGDVRNTDCRKAD